MNQADAFAFMMRPFLSKCKTHHQGEVGFNGD